MLAITTTFPKFQLVSLSFGKCWLQPPTYDPLCPIPVKSITRGTESTASNLVELGTGNPTWNALALHNNLFPMARFRETTSGEEI